MKRIHSKVWNDAWPIADSTYGMGDGRRSARRRFGVSLVVAGGLLTANALAGESRLLTAKPAAAKTAASHEAVVNRATVDLALAPGEPAADGSHADGGGTAHGRDVIAAFSAVGGKSSGTLGVSFGW